MRLNKENLPPTDGKWVYSAPRMNWCSTLNGQTHNSLGPAVIYDDGEKEWYINGKLHRLDGPAVERLDGAKQWWVNGLRHRLDGPAIEWADGLKYWYADGKMHRLDGPAIELADGTRQWWISGKQVSEQDFPSAIISFLLGVDEEAAKVIEQTY